MARSGSLAAAFALLVSAAPAWTAGDGPVVERILPPAPPWDGASRSLVVPADDPWITPAEASGLTATPSYDQTVAYLRRLEAAAPELTLVSIGVSPEGRDLWLAVVATGVEAPTPQALAASEKPILFAQAGIHAGEIDGKDAGLMLLRDLTVKGSKKALLEAASLLFVPIFNVDGHERASPYSRINQRGPERMGWRTTSRNLNLNRDYAKADTPEMRAMITALRTWQPDLYLDLHVTDGVDYQYDITWGSSGEQSYSPATARWLSGVMRPQVSEDLRAAGHIPGPLIFAVDNQDLRNGLFDWTASTPRFSDGYGAARHLPTVLVENHSLKPYDQRVLGTYVLLESTLRLLGRSGEALRQAVAADRALRPATVPLSWTVPQDRTPRTTTLEGIRAERVPSVALGGDYVRWTAEPIELTVPVFEPVAVQASVPRAAAYWIPPAWSEVIERLALHGIEIERIEQAREVTVERYRLVDPRIDPQPLEGHPRVTATTRSETQVVRFSPGRGAGLDRPAPRRPGGAAARARVAGLLLPVGILPRGVAAHRVLRRLRDGADRRCHARSRSRAGRAFRPGARGRPAAGRRPAGAADVVLPPVALLRRRLAPLSRGAGAPRSGRMSRPAAAIRL